ncbi:MAG TPA: hypothetical protein PKI93_05095 [Alphaproteobacteria bacterium]|nr:hypothetical protein [Alphaproteobacteria bacterium]HNS44720.1 hypothetical protein [Alphaproteobacteria bacterium]
MKQAAPGLEELKYKPTEGLSIAIPGGVGYLKGEFIHADQIHLAPVAEGNHMKALDFLSGKTRKRPMVYVGVGGMINFGYIARLKPDHVVLFDVNPLQTLFWEKCIERIPKNNLDQFIKFVSSSENLMADQLKNRFHDVSFSIEDCISYKYSIVDMPTSPHEWSRGFFRRMSPKLWAQGIDGIDHTWRTEDGYQTIKDLVATGNFETITLDIFDEERCHLVGEMVSRMGFETGVIYLNSLHRFLNRETDWTGRRGLDTSETTFRRNASLLLPTKERIFIHADHLTHHRNKKQIGSLEF